MFGYVETRDGDIPAFKPFAVERRSGRRRRRSPDFGNQDNKRHRNKFERRIDWNWRFAVIRRWMSRARFQPLT